MFETVLPRSVAVAESDDPGRFHGGLLPDEELDLGQVADGRRRDFTAGRALARRALHDLGQPAAPIRRGPRRQPLWPEAVVGSIAHCPGYCAAAAALASDWLAVGIDVEVTGPLADGVVARVCTEAERRDLPRSAGDEWARVAFSAKEAVYKAWFPLTGRWLGFHDVHLTATARDGAFTVEVLVPAPDGLTRFDGRFAVADRHVFAAVAVPRLNP